MFTATAGCAAISPAASLQAVAATLTILPAAGGCMSQWFMHALLPNIIAPYLPLPDKGQEISNSLITGIEELNKIAAL